MDQVFAIGEDKYWLEAVQKAADDKVTIHTIHCSDTLVNCLDYLPKTDLNTLLLIDAYSKVNISEVVSILSQRGWRYIIVVAADPSVKEIYKVLHKSGGYDYWEKTYIIPVIQAEIKKCLAEIQKHNVKIDSKD